MMWHGHARRPHGAVNVTTATFCCARLRGSIRQRPRKRIVPRQSRSVYSRKSRRNWTPARNQWPRRPADSPAGIYMLKKRPRARRQRWRSAQCADSKPCTKAGSHAFQSAGLLCLGASVETLSLEGRTLADTSVVPSLFTAACPEGCRHGADHVHGVVTHNSRISELSALENKTERLSRRRSSEKHPPWKKRPTFSTYKEASTAFPLMRFSFNVQSQCRVRKPRLGSQRKAKHLYRISTLRSKKLKAEVLNYLSSLSTESKSLTKEVNGDELLKLKSKNTTPSAEDGVELAWGTMVQDGSVSETPPAVPAAGNGRTSARKRTPKSCDCCGASCKPLGAKAHRAEKAGQRGQGAARRGRKKKGGEQEVPSADGEAGGEPAELNGVTGSESDPSGDMEVEPPTSSPDTCANPLWDHHYCKTEAGNADSEMEDSLPRARQSTDISSEEITEHIHDFLEHFYEKYGSFIPLCESDVLEQLSQKFGPDLTHRKSLVCTEVTKYKAGLASAPMHYFKVTYNKHTLTLEDLSTLDDQNWVNDQVINMYGELIMDAVNQKVHFFNSFFHRQLVAKGYEGVKRWTKKVDLFSKSLLLIPIHLEIHWSLITVDICNQQINFYDSQGITFKHVVDNILRYILAEAKEKKCAVYQKGWKMIINKSIPQQKNDSDCGVFVLEYCKCLAMKEPLQFTQEDMPKVRKRIYKELCECQLKERNPHGAN
ncbi:uncharacterized protein [Paramormyrops kingsleyae]|uniref:uncharacterized protein n=1 Tax=Paramormyrops kingsleyae TaxID=1676925 RepID=UPI003B9792A8